MSESREPGSPASSERGPSAPLPQAPRAGAMSTRPVVAIVGRPNVGKSTLVNRIVGGRRAIVEEKPGVTRDRKELVGEWNGREFTVVDTGGWLPDGVTTADPVALTKQVSRQAERAMRNADVIVLVVDGVVGVAEEDDRVARMLRSAETPVLVAVNCAPRVGRQPERAWT